jgi:hypothetical protein
LRFFLTRRVMDRAPAALDAPAYLSALNALRVDASRSTCGIQDPQQEGSWAQL